MVFNVFMVGRLKLDRYTTEKMKGSVLLNPAEKIGIAQVSWGREQGGMQRLETSVLHRQTNQALY